MLGNGRGTAVGGAAAELADAVHRLRGELVVHRPVLPDQAIAEDELDALSRAAAAAERAPGAADSERIRHSLLLIAAVIGSVRALAAPLDALREAVEHVAPPHP